MNTQTQIFKDTAVQEMADTLKAAGMKVFYTPSKTPY